MLFVGNCSDEDAGKAVIERFVSYPHISQK